MGHYKLLFFVYNDCPEDGEGENFCLGRRGGGGGGGGGGNQYSPSLSPYKTTLIPLWEYYIDHYCMFLVIMQLYVYHGITVLLPSIKKKHTSSSCFINFAPGSMSSLIVN